MTWGGHTGRAAKAGTVARDAGLAIGNFDQTLCCRHLRSPHMFHVKLAIHRRPATAGGCHRARSMMAVIAAEAGRSGSLAGCPVGGNGLHYPVQIIEGCELDDYLPLALAELDLDSGVERIG
jgi:hypothetical protein